MREQAGGRVEQKGHKPRLGQQIEAAARRRRAGLNDQQTTAQDQRQQPAPPLTVAHQTLRTHRQTRSRA